MHLKKLFFLVLICNFLVAFTNPQDIKKTTIYIVKSSERLSKTNFELKEGTVLLNDTKKYKLYVEITAEEADAYQVHSDTSKKSAKGVQYNITYIYEYILSGEKKHHKDQYIVLDNGPILSLKTVPKIKVGEITLKTEIGAN